MLLFLSEQTAQAAVLGRLSFSMCLWLNESSFRITFNPSFYPNVDLDPDGIILPYSVPDLDAIWIRRAKSERIHLDNNPDPDPDQAMSS